MRFCMLVSKPKKILRTMTPYFMVYHKQFSGLCFVKRQGSSFFTLVAATAPKVQNSFKCSVALCCNLHSSWSPNFEGQCSLHCNNFNMYYWMGWWLCSSYLCKACDVWEELQARAILFRQSKKTSLSGGIPMDLLHMFCIPFANSVPNYLGYFQLCTSCFGGRFGSNNALVAFRC